MSETTGAAPAPRPPAQPAAKTADEMTVDEFADRVLSAALGAVDVFAIYLGDRLGWYQALARGPATPKELVERAGGHERYAREWLEQQAVAGILTVAEQTPAAPEGGVGTTGGEGSPAGGGSAGGNGSARRYTLPPAAAEVLTDESSLAYLAPLARLLPAAAAQLGPLLRAYRTGGGVSWAEFGPEARESQADMNRPWFERELARALEPIGDLDEVLRRPGARIADVGTGAGWSSIALARAYPQAAVDGFDVDPPSIDLARVNAERAGLSGQVRFEHRDGRELPAEHAYDAVFAFECLHDMSAPVEVLAAMRRMVRPDGVVIVMDEAVGEEFQAPGDEVERLMYGFSLLVCLPDGMSTRPTAATGTVMRPDILRRYATQAGYSSVEVLPVHDFGFFRFYRLRL